MDAMGQKNLKRKSTKIEMQKILSNWKIAEKSEADQKFLKLWS